MLAQFQKLVHHPILVWMTMIAVSRHRVHLAQVIVQVAGVIQALVVQTAVLVQIGNHAYTKRTRRNEAGLYPDG